MFICVPELYPPGLYRLLLLYLRERSIKRWDREREVIKGGIKKDDDDTANNNTNLDKRSFGKQ